MVPSHTPDLNGSAGKTGKAMFIRYSKNCLIVRNQVVTEKKTKYFRQSVALHNLVGAMKRIG
jgi:hypothetical protein